MQILDRQRDRPRRLLRWIFLYFGSVVLALAIMDWILNDFVTDGFKGLIIAAVFISVALALLLPIAYKAIGWLAAILFPIFIFAASGGIVLLAGWVNDRLGFDAFSLANLETAIWVTLGLTAITTLLGTFFRSMMWSYDRFVTKPLRAQIGNVPKSDQPAFLFLEIDGLAGPILEQAIAEGYAPKMKRWIDSGAYQLTVWEPDLSCQTGASQAGILLGSNEGIPAFRWWDKRLKKMLVVSNRDSAKALEAELSDGKELLQLNGASRFNVFSGGATDSIGTFSRLSFGTGSASFWVNFLNPYSFTRLVSLFLQDVGHAAQPLRAPPEGALAWRRAHRRLHRSRTAIG